MAKVERVYTAFYMALLIEVQSVWCAVSLQTKEELEGSKQFDLE